MGCICEFSHRCIEKLKERVPDCLKCSTNKNRNKDKDIDRYYEVNNNDLSSDTTSKNKPTTPPADEFPKINGEYISFDKVDNIDKNFKVNNDVLLSQATSKTKMVDQAKALQTIPPADEQPEINDLPTPKTYIDSDASMRPDANNNHSDNEISRISHTSSDSQKWIRYAANNQSIMTIAPQQSNNSSWHPKYEYFDERFEKQPDSTFAPKKSNNHDLPTSKRDIDSDASMRPDANNNYSDDKISTISHTSSDSPYTPSIVTIAPNQSNNSSWHPKYEYFDERFEKQPNSTFAPKKSNNPDNQPHRYSESEIKTLI